MGPFVRTRKAILLLRKSWQDLLSYTRAMPTMATPPMDVDFALSIMLIGSVAFVLTLFYLLNSQDVDIKRFSWGVLSGSICTFMGVRLGTAYNACWSFYVAGPDASLESQIMAFGVLAIGWYLLLQFILAYWCGLLTGKHDPDFKALVLNLKCWAVMLGVVTGSSSMSFFSLIQEYEKSNLVILYSMPLFTFLVLTLIYHLGDSARHHVASLDGHIDDFEEAFDRFSDETEDVVIGLAVSHVITQTLRFSLTGTLPAPTGASRPGTEVEYRDIVSLASSSIVYVILFLACEQCIPKSWGRLKKRFKMILANCVAFALFYSFTWFALTVLELQGPAQGLVVALGVTWGGFAVMVFLDKLADLDCTGPVFDQNLRNLVMPISTLIGFGWKGAFADAGASLVQKVHWFPAPLEQAILAVFLLSVILPAWRLYILPKVMYDYMKQVKKKKLLDAEGRYLEVVLDEELDKCLDKLESIVTSYPSERHTHHKAIVLELERLRKISENIVQDAAKMQP